jgi:uncharacterized protein (DUF433 family)
LLSTFFAHEQVAAFCLLLYIGIIDMKALKMKRVKLGQYVVADPEICHGVPTFVGTRIMVDQVLKMVAEDTPWEEIIREYDGAIARAAIAEAVRLAGRSFSEKNAARRAG